MIHFVGLDVHRKEIRACGQDPTGQILWEEDLPATYEGLTAFAHRRLGKQDQVALEATFNSWAIARILEPFVARVVVSNPLQTKAIAQAKIKTDKVDARVLCHLLRCEYLPEVWMPDPKTEQMRTLTARRSGLVAERTRLKNRIHSVLAQSLIPRPDGDLFSQKGQQWLKSLPLSPLAQQLIQSDQRLMEHVQEELSLLEQTLAKEAYQDPKARLLMTLPGVDSATAQTILAALGDITRFRDGNHAASYLGLVPSVRQSAEHCYHGPITKRGSAKARWMLIQAAQHAASHPGPLGVFFRRLARKKSRNVAIVACARKMVVIVWHMLKEEEPYRYAQPRPTQDKLARLRVKATGKKRTGGTKKGETRSVNYGSGERTRRIPSLPTVLEQEDLPAAKPLKKGEHKALQSMQIEDYFQSIQSSQIRKRKTPTEKVGGERSLAAEGRPLEPDRANGKASLPADAIKSTHQLADFALPINSTAHSKPQQ